MATLSHEDCFVVPAAFEAVGPEVAERDGLNEWRAKLNFGVLAEVEPDGAYESSFWILKFAELLEY